MLEDRFAQHDKVVVDKFIDPEVSVLMTTRDYVVRPTANPTTGPIVLVLPPVAEAKGRFYSILARDADGTNTITVTDRDDSECWINDIVLNNKCDRLLMYSDGLTWIPCAGAGPGNWPGVSTTLAPGTTTSSP
jgi:hypothetical protein